MLKIADQQQRTIDLNLNTPLYATDTTTFVTKLVSGGKDIFSPFAVDAANFAVRISVGGVLQVLTVRKAAALNVRLIAASETARDAVNQTVDSIVSFALAKKG